MSQRESGYERIPFDEYPTPEWVTIALSPHLSGVEHIWEPAAGSGQMVRALESVWFKVSGTDIQQGEDFFTITSSNFDAIVTNPPYSLATEFIEHALHLMKPNDGTVAMLLRADFDSAKGRRHLFADNPAFVKKLVLTKRIVWVENEGKKASPSFNHAWFIWDWRNAGKPPVLAYDFQ